MTKIVVIVQSCPLGLARVVGRGGGERRGGQREHQQEHVQRDDQTAHRKTSVGMAARSLPCRCGRLGAAGGRPPGRGRARPCLPARRRGLRGLRRPHRGGHHPRAGVRADPAGARRRPVALARGRRAAGARGVVADDDAARALAESAAAFLPPDTAPFLPSRGVGWGSGLDPAPHLVGERHRGLHALARGGLVAVSADALIERIEPSGRRPAPVELRLGEEMPFDDLVRVAGRRRLRAGRRRSRSAASSRSAAAWSTSSRRRAASRCGWSSSATRSSGCRPSRSSPSARCATSPSVADPPRR